MKNLFEAGGINLLQNFQRKKEQKTNQPTNPSKISEFLHNTDTSQSAFTHSKVISLPSPYFTKKRTNQRRISIFFRHQIYHPTPTCAFSSLTQLIKWSMPTDKANPSLWPMRALELSILLSSISSIQAYKHAEITSTFSNCVL